MKLSKVGVCACTALLIAPAIALLSAADSHSTVPSGLVVHEWGTFTSVAGENGAAIDWDALGCQSDLPGFVNEYGFRGFKGRLRGTVRMETPVVYFYSDHDVDARVKVTFPQGLITEWYPQADVGVYQKSRQDGSLRKLDPKLNGFDSSMRSLMGAIEWKGVRVRPGANPRFPREGAPDRYYAARETDAAPVDVGGQNEKFLFYRGVGRLAVPLSARMTAESGPGVLVENQSGSQIPAVLFFENRGGKIGYSGSGGALDKSVKFGFPTPGASLDRLKTDLAGLLIAQGLYPREAAAMVRTWEDSWFEEGSRLIYIVPAASVDAALPLEVEPAPARTVRVFVGRLELITPQMESAAAAEIAKADWTSLARHGRFLVPLLERVYHGDWRRISEVERHVGCH